MGGFCLSIAAKKEVDRNFGPSIIQTFVLFNEIV